MIPNFIVPAWLNQCRSFSIIARRFYHYFNRNRWLWLMFGVFFCFLSRNLTSKSSPTPRMLMTPLEVSQNSSQHGHSKSITLVQLSSLRFKNVFVSQVAQTNSPHPQLHPHTEINRRGFSPPTRYRHQLSMLAINVDRGTSDHEQRPAGPGIVKIPPTVRAEAGRIHSLSNNSLLRRPAKHHDHQHHPSQGLQGQSSPVQSQLTIAPSETSETAASARLSSSLSSPSSSSSSSSSSTTTTSLSDSPLQYLIDSDNDLSHYEFPTELSMNETDRNGKLIVDAVFTYVNPLDPHWKRMFHEFAESQSHDSSSKRIENRYRDWGELRYSMRSVFMYAPWIRHIYLVLAFESQLPDWLDIHHPRIRIVYHHQILPAKYLPTFNSLVIESALHRIEGLAPHYLYFNNDVFLNHPVNVGDTFGTQHHYFRYHDWLMPTGVLGVPELCNFYVDHTWLPYPLNHPASRIYFSIPNPAVVEACSGLSFFWNRALSQYLFNVRLTNWFAHMPHFFHRRSMYVVESKLGPFLQRSRLNRIRNPTSDISILLMYESFLEHIKYAVETRQQMPAQLASLQKQVIDIHMMVQNFNYEASDKNHKFYAFTVFGMDDIKPHDKTSVKWYWNLLSTLRTHGPFVGIDDAIDQELDAIDSARHRCRMRLIMHLIWHETAPWERTPDADCLDRSSKTPLPVKETLSLLNDDSQLMELLLGQCFRAR